MGETRRITLLRVTQNAYNGTHGVLIDCGELTSWASHQAGTPFALTLEPPWRDNEKNISCIPAGLYNCEFNISPKFGPTYEVMGVPNRSHILFHKGNFTHNTKGCILVGEQFEKTKTSEASLLASAKGFGEFMHLNAGPVGEYKSFVLTIINTFEVGED
jgi:hypothetical protein